MTWWITTQKQNSIQIRTSALVQACLRSTLVVADEAKLAIVFTYFFLFFFFFFLCLLLFTHFGSCGLHAPPMVADEAKLVIVFTYIFGSGVLACSTSVGGQSEADHSFNLLFVLFGFFFFFLRLLLFTYFGDTQEANFFNFNLWPAFGRGNLDQP